jgi:hypothetical protein
LPLKLFGKKNRYEANNIRVTREFFAPKANGQFPDPDSQEPLPLYHSTTRQEYNKANIWQAVVSKVNQCSQGISSAEIRHVLKPRGKVALEKSFTQYVRTTVGE